MKVRRIAVLVAFGMLVVTGCVEPPPTPTQATVSGTVTITGQGSAFNYFMRVAICPGVREISHADYFLGGEQLGTNCPVVGVDDIGGYTANLDPGEWSLALLVSPAYDLYEFGPTTHLSLAAGDSVTADLAIAWPGTATISGTVAVDAVPTWWATQALGKSVNLCPGDTYVPNCPGMANATVSNDDGFWASVPAGTWTVQAGYFLDFMFNRSVLPGSTTVPETLTLAPGTTATRDIRLPWQVAGLLSGTVTTTGVPTGDTVSLEVHLCPGTTMVVEACDGGFRTSSPGSFADWNSGNYFVGLPPGTWSVAAGYRLRTSVGVPSALLHLGASTTVVVTADATTTRSVSVAYAG